MNQQLFVDYNQVDYESVDSKLGTLANCLLAIPIFALIVTVLTGIIGIIILCGANYNMWGDSP